MTITRVGIDISKSVFFVHAVDESEKTAWKAKFRRSQWVDALVKRVPTTAIIAIEACGSSHHWSRHLKQLGYQVKLIPPQFVKPYVKSNKNDAIDAEAICEAASRANMRFVKSKSLQQQDRQTIHRIREDLMSQKVSKINHIRGLCAEYGLFAPEGVNYIHKAIPEWLEDAQNGVSFLFRNLLSDLYKDLLYIEDRIEEVTKTIQADLQTNPSSQKLLKVRGIGPIIASALLTVLDSENTFAQGRDFAASLGLTPRQNSTGGKTKLLGISKRGNGYLRKLLVHGARSVIMHAHKHDDALSQWIERLKSRKHINVVTVALANKLARIAWVIVTKGGDFDSDKAASFKIAA